MFMPPSFVSCRCSPSAIKEILQSTSFPRRRESSVLIWTPAFAGVTVYSAELTGLHLAVSDCVYGFGSRAFRPDLYPHFSAGVGRNEQASALGQIR